jgi:hypothetical protein
MHIRQTPRSWKRSGRFDYPISIRRIIPKKDYIKGKPEDDPELNYK